MKILLSVLQVLGALLYGSSGAMKVFMFKKVSKDRILWRVAAGRLDGTGHPGTCLHRRADRPRWVAVATATDHFCCRTLGGREPRLHLGAHQVSRNHAEHLERRAGASHGVYRVWPDGSQANRLTARTWDIDVGYGLTSHHSRGTRCMRRASQLFR